MATNWLLLFLTHFSMLTQDLIRKSCWWWWLSILCVSTCSCVSFILILTFSSALSSFRCLERYTTNGRQTWNKTELERHKDEERGWLSSRTPQKVDRSIVRQHGSPNNRVIKNLSQEQNKQNLCLPRWSQLWLAKTTFLLHQTGTRRPEAAQFIDTPGLFKHPRSQKLAWPATIFENW